MCKLCKLCIKNDGRSGGFLAISKQKTPKMTKTPEKKFDVATKLHYFSNEKQKIKTCSIQKSISLPADSLDFLLLAFFQAICRVLRAFSMF